MTFNQLLSCYAEFLILYGKYIFELVHFELILMLLINYKVEYSHMLNGFQLSPSVDNVLAEAMGCI